MENGDTAAVHGATHSPAIRVRSTHTSFGRIERGSVITMASGASPFRPLSLSHGDAAYLKELVHVFVQHQVESYERYLHEDHEHIDNKRWKLTLQRDNVKVFSEQAGAKGSNPVDDPGFVNEQEPPDMADLPALLAVGHMEGSLDDAMLKIELGFVSRVGGLVPKKLWFCTYCLDEAARTSSRVVACGEHTDTRLYEPTPWSSGSTGVSSPSSSDRDDEWGSLDSKRYLNLLP
ncbi:hypothetical protein PRIC1_014167 [Phytophthora ramorum]